MSNEEVVDENDDDDDCDDIPVDESDDNVLDPETSEALEVIKTTPWLDESIANYQRHDSMQPLFENRDLLPHFETWKEDMDKQNKEKLDNFEPDEEETTPTEFLATGSDEEADVDFSIEQASMEDLEKERNRIKMLKEDIISNKTLTEKQQQVFEMATDNIIKRHFKETTQQLIAYIGGEGGTGKSQVIKSIVEFMEKMNVRHTLKLCAPTGTAAKNIGGNTTTTLFGFSSRVSANIQRKFENVEMIILDEISMVGCKQLVDISKALSKGKCCDPSIPFGGVDMLFYGDFIQFPPVKDSVLYSGWSQKKTNSSNKGRINKELGTHLWKQVNKVVILDKQMRVTDQVYLDFLHRLREGKCTDNDVQMLNRRVVGQSVDITSILDAPIITPGNKLVMAINDLFVAHYSQHTKVYVSKAIDSVGKKSNRKELPKKVADKIKNWPSTSTRGLPRELKLFIGMPVIVTNNIATELGITNGTTGYVRSIHFKPGEVITGDTGYHHLKHSPDYVIVELENINMKPLDGLPPNHVPIMLKAESFAVSMPGKKKSVTVNRRHFPIVPRFSCTAHKSQGQTLPKAIVDLVPRNGKTKGLGTEFAYVPLSRVRRLQDVNILRPFDRSILTIPKSQALTDMLSEMSAKMD